MYTHIYKNFFLFHCQIFGISSAGSRVPATVRTTGRVPLGEGGGSGGAQSPQHCKRLVDGEPFKKRAKILKNRSPEAVWASPWGVLECSGRLQAGSWLKEPSWVTRGFLSGASWAALGRSWAQFGAKLRAKRRPKSIQNRGLKRTI